MIPSPCAFTQAQIYKRSDIQDRFGGQRQGGISTPAKSPVILIFTSSQGEQYGYSVGWNSGIFYYTGEGQVGDMEFKGGNKAIRDDSSDGKDIHLFGIPRSLSLNMSASLYALDRILGGAQTSTATTAAR